MIHPRGQNRASQFALIITSQRLLYRIALAVVAVTLLFRFVLAPQAPLIVDASLAALCAGVIAVMSIVFARSAGR